MKLGKIVQTDYRGNALEGIVKGVPQLEVHGFKGKENEQEHTYYVSPFRGYGFQASETISGLWDAGTSEFTGLLELERKLDNNRMTERVFKSMIMECLHDHARRYDNGWSPSFEETNIIWDFTTECYEYIKMQNIKMQNEINKQMEVKAQDTKFKKVVKKLTFQK